MFIDYKTDGKTFEFVNDKGEKKTFIKDSEEEKQAFAEVENHLNPKPTELTNGLMSESGEIDVVEEMPLVQLNPIETPEISELTSESNE